MDGKETMMEELHQEGCLLTVDTLSSILVVGDDEQWRGLPERELDALRSSSK